MRFEVRTDKVNPQQLMKKAGYQEHRDSAPHKLAFIKKLRSGNFPRFHLFIYPVKSGVGFDVDLHLDWREPLHRIEANSSENDSDVVREETARIHVIAAALAKG